MSDVVWIVPCFNEENRLKIQEFLLYAKEHQVSFLFVNDGSTDKTLALLEYLKSESDFCHYLNLTQNLGKANAIRQGVLYIQEKFPQFLYVGYLDADLATPLDQLEFLMTIIRENNFEMVIGSRVNLLGRTIQRRPMRHYLGRIFSTVVSIILDLSIYDTQCGAKIFKNTQKLWKVFEKPFISRWIFDVEIIQRYKKLYPEFCNKSKNSFIFEFPLYKWIDIKGSKLRPWDFIQAIYELLLIKFSK